ncbi:hypothetical protein ABZ461_11700 [Actinacidiphila glaucinigra]|uniref:hypothetical protein n=1 Tax=Actinacidiphila glaucinigra TaxID=235986 RepID=UPI0033C5B98E
MDEFNAGRASSAHFASTSPTNGEDKRLPASREAAVTGSMSSGTCVVRDRLMIVVPSPRAGPGRLGRLMAT